MARRATDIRFRALGLALLLSLLAHAWYMGPEYRTGMLWTCHVATVLIAAGMLAGQRWLVALGTVAHLGMGFPAWLVETVTTGWIAVTSVLVHVLPMAAGVVYMLRFGMAARAAFGAWLLWVVMVPVSYFAADPQLNVNLSRAAWPAVQPWFPGMWSFHIFVAAIAAPVLWLVDRFLRVYVARYARVQE